MLIFNILIQTNKLEEKTKFHAFALNFYSHVGNIKNFIYLCPELNLITLNVPYKIVKFYIDGFRSMTVGKTLWLIIGIKLFIMFAVLKVFFFPNFLKTNFNNDSERSEYIINQLTK